MTDGCRIVLNGETVFESDRRGIAPLVEVIDRGLDVGGATAYDKIVGKAAALLYAYMNVIEVNAGVMSDAGAAVLDSHGIVNSCETRTEKIINRRGDGICPMEKAVADIDEPAVAYVVLKSELKLGGSPFGVKSS